MCTWSHPALTISFAQLEWQFETILFGWSCAQEVPGNYIFQVLLKLNPQPYVSYWADSKQGKDGVPVIKRLMIYSSEKIHKHM